MAEPTAIVPDKGIRPGLNETGSAIGKELFVKTVAGSNPDSVEVAGAGEQVKGVSVEQIEANGDRGDVQVEGMARVTSGAAVARGANVAADAAGKAVTAGTGDIVAGVARSAAAGADEIISIEMTAPAGFVSP